jgi:hypothetical protein
MRLSYALLLMVGWSSSCAFGQEWAEKMFEHRGFDFGTVARGAKIEHHFPFQNVFEEDMNITSVTSSCHCTVPTVTKSVLKKWEKADVVATIDTVTFSGPRHATVTVKISGLKGGLTFAGEVNLDVAVNIRQDVVVQPGVVNFGTIPQGTLAERKTTIAYAPGLPNWQITAVQNNNPNLDYQLREFARNIQQVSYELTVSVKANARPGYINDQLVLVTNDLNPNASRVQVPVEGMVMSGVTVRPSPLLLGVVMPGQSVSKKLVVQSQTPLRITGITCTDSRFHFDVPELAKTLQLLPVLFTAPTGVSPETVAQTIHITTDAVGTPAVEVSVQVRITAADQDGEPPAVVPTLAPLSTGTVSDAASGATPLVPFKRELPADSKPAATSP